jgi:DNA-binding cell septation regulator SpoVG
MDVNKKAQGVSGAAGPSNKNGNDVEVYPQNGEQTNGRIEVLVADMNLSPKAGSKVRGYADVEIWVGTEVIVIFGLRIIVVGDKPPWVSFPSRKGTSPGKYFPVVEVKGMLKEMIADAVVAAYGKALVIPNINPKVRF